MPVSTEGSLAQVERWAQEAATAIVLFIPTDAPSPATILETAAALPSVVGVSLEALDEELTPVLSAPEDYAVFSPGLEFASAYRVGATAFEGEFGLLGPAACAEAIELARTDLPQALQLERTLQRLIEGTFERVTRGLVPAQRAALLAATFAFFEEEGGAPPSEIAPDLWTEWRLAIHGAGLFPADSD